VIAQNVFRVIGVLAALILIGISGGIVLAVGYWTARALGVSV